MYESPVLRRMRAVTQDAVAEAEFVEQLVDAIENDSDVREALLKLIAGNRPRQTRPTTTTPIRKGGRR
ncbi:hypothetical protein QMK19_03655 [Streptomyces sp. H10-C2]|uniref:hypothetical protein n=1 Tax=unclassified Streptomyces TaxID=2593676 RepID=UPI0024B9D829|nr:MULTISPECIES: hypothetical protein [unclassified Streptomyces]MDJ0342283.1 hypothetical protein [Streptomyces sp. PH10-H1]MDJ0368797.1 hypothetical protein [Streptomyces sp. H10-C2]